MKKTTGLIIICTTRADAQVVKKELAIFSSPNIWINKSHLTTSNANNGTELGVWEQDYDPVVPDDFPNPVFIQGSLPVQELIANVKAHYAPQIARKKEAFKLLRSIFHEFEYEEFDNPLNYWARIIRKSYSSPFDLDDIEKGYEFLFDEWLDAKIIESFKTQYPFLYPYAFMDYWKNGKKPSMIISTIHSKDHPNSEGTSTGVRMPYPLSAESAQEMNRLNKEARKYVEEDDNFFCTGCHQTKPRDEYKAYLFHVVKCKECSTPAFEHAARSETYN